MSLAAPERPPPALEAMETETAMEMETGKRKARGPEIETRRFVALASM